MNILIIRAFVRLREMLAAHKDLARKMQELERQQHAQAADIAAIYKLIQRLIGPPQDPKRRPIGFISENVKNAQPRGQQEKAIAAAAQ